MTRLTSWLTGALLDHSTWMLELFLAVQALVWGRWLLAPWEAFAVLPSAFTILGMIPEPVWGVIFTAHGALHLIALSRGDLRFCRRAVLALAGLWAAVFVSLFITIPSATTSPIYGMNLMGSALVYLSLHRRFA